MKLEVLIEPECHDAAFWMAGIYDPGFPFRQMGELASEVCRKLRTIAISVLCVRGDVNTYQHNLIRSGRVRERYLARCIAENNIFDHHCSSGWYSPFIDTVAAGDFQLANRIAYLSPDGFRAGHEYEDDYCYVQLIYSLIGEGKKGRDLLLNQFAAYAGAEPLVRLELIGSLLTRNQKAFDDAFERLLQEHKQRMDAEIESGRFEDLHVNADRRLFVEGLAVLRLASMCGLKTEDEYLFCPSIARMPPTKPFPGE